MVSDAQEILGIGDWGANGIAISVGKLAVYTAAAGIHPERVVAVNVDVGTDNEALLNDPAYLGNRHAWVDRKTYDEFIALYLRTASELFPTPCCTLRTSGRSNARRILVDNSKKYRIFNDDMQGTGAIVMAVVFSGLKVTGQASWSSVCWSTAWGRLDRHGRSGSRRHGPRRGQPRSGRPAGVVGRRQRAGHRRHGRPAGLPAALRPPRSGSHRLGQ